MDLEEKLADDKLISMDFVINDVDISYFNDKEFIFCLPTALVQAKEYTVKKFYSRSSGIVMSVVEL